PSKPLVDSQTTLVQTNKANYYTKRTTTPAWISAATFQACATNFSSSAHSTRPFVVRSLRACRRMQPTSPRATVTSSTPGYFFHVVNSPGGIARTTTPANSIGCLVQITS